MKIPYVIDNQSYRLSAILNQLLAGHSGKSLDVATAYFNVQGFRLLKAGLDPLGSFRLLLGDEPGEGAEIGLRPKEPKIVRGLWGDLEKAPFTEETLRTIEDLIAFLRRENVSIRVYENGFLHAKCWLFYGDPPSSGWDRFQPVAAIVGSSNFTAPGLTTNKELNLSHKALFTDEEVQSAATQLAFGAAVEESLQQTGGNIHIHQPTATLRWLQGSLCRLAVLLAAPCPSVRVLVNFASGLT